MDVDDLTHFAYILQTTPAALLTPPEGASPPTGVPSGQFNHEEIQAWVLGQAKFTTEDLARYWKDEYFSAVSSMHYYENLMMQYAKDGKGNQMHRGTYEERLITTTMNIYSHVTPRMQKAAVDRSAAHLDRA